MKKLITLVLLVLTVSLLLVSCKEELVTISVEYKTTEGGTVIGEIAQSIEVAPGESASFNAVKVRAKSGYRFIGWDDGKTNATRSDVLSENAVFTAKFEKIIYGTVEYTCPEGGVIIGTATQTLEVGQTTEQITVEPLEGYRFLGWSDGVTELSRTDVVDGDKSVTALFSNKVSVEYLSTEGGYIMEIEGLSYQELKYGETSRLVQAMAKPGYRFKGWDDGKPTEKRHDVVKEDVVYTAIFTKYYTVEFLYDEGCGVIKGETLQKVDEGDYIMAVIAEPLEGYEFVAWSNGSKEPKMFFEVTGDTRIKAYFARESSGLPVVSINTVKGAAITSKESYISCDVSIHDPDGDTFVIMADAQIKGRGNSTWKNFPKKPYKIKFDKKTDLFGFGEAKDWVLLANYIDKSLLRNYLVYKTAREMSALVSSPDCQLVEVYLNGEYNGVYLLCEQVEVNENRVEISEVESADVLDTGYLVEMDGWADGICVTVPDSLKTDTDRKYSIKAPNIVGISVRHRTFIENYLKNSLEAINGTDYELVKALVDVESFAQAYIIFELFKNPDVDYSSFYMYKDAGGKLMCGPVWDFDMSLGNVSHKGTDVQKYNYLWARYKNPWFKGLLEHEEFRQLVAEQLLENKQTILATLDECYLYAYDKQEALEKNFEKWDILGQYVWDPSYIIELDTWEEQTEWTRDYLEKSLNFLLETYPVS